MTSSSVDNGQQELVNLHTFKIYVDILTFRFMLIYDVTFEVLNHKNNIMEG